MNKTTVLSVLAQSTTSSPERTTTARVERACASCHRRKVKCIKQGQDINSCKRCQSDNLTCNPRQKGPKRRRAKKVSKLRENAGSPQDMDFEAQSISSTSTREHDLLPLDLVHSCVDFFSVNIYPFTPVIEHHKAFEVVEKMGRSTEAYFLIVALCAYVMIYVNKYDLFHMLNSPKFTPMSGMALCHTLLEKLERVCIFGNATYLSVLTSWFYCGIHLGLAREDIASSRLFKTIKLAQSLGMHDEGRCTPCERALYWVLLMAYMRCAQRDQLPINHHHMTEPPPLEEFLLHAHLDCLMFMEPDSGTLWIPPSEEIYSQRTLSNSVEATSGLVGTIKSRSDG